MNKQKCLGQKEKVRRATEAEVLFIRRLGEHSPIRRKLEKKECLLGYLQAFEQRTDWGYIDKKIALATAKSELAKLHVKQPPAATSREEMFEGIAKPVKVRKGTLQDAFTSIATRIKVKT